MQRYGDRRPSSNNNNTYALAQFLATTGPEQFKRPNYENHDSHQLIKMVPFQYNNNNNNNKTNNFFDRLRKKKKPSTSSFHQTSSSSSTSTSTSSFQQHKYKHQQQQSSSSSFNNNKKKHIPLIDESYLPYYLQQPPQQNHKLINQNDKESEKKLKEIKKEEETKLPSFPTPPPSSMHDFDEDHQHQNNPSLTTSSTTTTTTSSSLSTSAATTHHNNIKGVRHMEVQTDDIIEQDEEKEEFDKDHSDPLLKRILHNNGDEEKDRCNHCCRPYQQYTIEKQQRRKSSPASLSSGAKIKLGQEATVLLALIEQLKQQLAEEQQSRLLLEKTIQLQFLEKSL